MWWYFDHQPWYIIVANGDEGVMMIMVCVCMSVCVCGKGSNGRYGGM